MIPNSFLKGSKLTQFFIVPLGIFFPALDEQIPAIPNPRESLTPAPPEARFFQSPDPPVAYCLAVTRRSSAHRRSRLPATDAALPEQHGRSDAKAAARFLR
jgi:hypothetical protein